MKRLVIILLIAIATISLKAEGQKTILCGKIILGKDYPKEHMPYSVSVKHWWPVEYPEYSILKFTNNNFSFEFELNQEKIIFLNLDLNEQISKKITRRQYFDFSDGKIAKISKEIFLEPGDSLYVIIDFCEFSKNHNPQFIYHGEHAANTNYLNFKEKTRFSKPADFIMYGEKRSNYDAEAEYQNKIKKLQNAKDSLSKTFYQYELTNLKYKYLWQDFNSEMITLQSLYNKPNIKANKSFAKQYSSSLDTIQFRKELLSSFSYRHSLFSYLNYLQLLIYGNSEHLNLKELNSLAKLVFDKEHHKVFLYELIQRHLETSFKQDEIYWLVQDFNTLYKETSEAKILSERFGEHQMVMPHKPAPNIIVKDIYDRKINLNKYKGKVVLLGINRFYGLKHLKEKVNNLPENVISVFANYELNYYNKLFLEQGTFPKAHHIVNADNYVEQFKPYKFLANDLFYLIGKDGYIRYHFTSLEDIDLINSKIDELNQRPYNLLTRSSELIKKHYNIIIPFLIGIVIAVLMGLSNSFRKRKKQQSQNRILQSELKAIRSQLNPHFLFNSLNSIQNFINKQETENANIHLAKFAGLMRQVLEYSEKDTVSINEELEFTRTYAELEALRYGFQIKWSIDSDLDIHNIEIPSLILQPFVENAIVHALSEKGEAGILGIECFQKNNELICFTISDNGNGINTTENNGGFGLKSSKERINILNSQLKEKISLKIINQSELKVNETGTLVEICISIKE